MANKFKPPCKGRKTNKCKQAPKSCKLTNRTMKRRTYCRKNGSSKKSRK